MSHVALLLLAALLGDWPHVRGPGYDAHSAETGLADIWPAGAPPALWSRELGQGYSGVVVAGGRAFTQYQTPAGQYVLALDAGTGAELWLRRVDWPWQAASAYPGPYATPTWADGRVYFATPSGRVGCLDAADGREVWSLDVRARFRGVGTEFGYAATPLVEGGRVILPVGGPGASVVTLDARDGSTVWADGDDPASYCPAYPVTFAGRQLIVAYLRNAIALHDAATGKALWREELSANYDEHSAWPLYAEPLLMVAAPYKAGARLWRLAAEGGGVAGRPGWVSRSLSNDVCSSVLHGGHVYGFDLQQLQASPHRASRGKFKCLDFATGAVHWETDRVGQATALVADGKLFLLTDAGELVLARVNPDAYEELGRARVLDRLCWTPPALSGGRLYVRSPGRLVCLHVGPPGDAPAGGTPVAVPASPPLDWSRLLTREPEYPHDAPEADDVARWFAWCVGGVFAPAGLLALAARRRWAFAAAAFALGAVGTSAYSAWADAFVLTWPASLYVAFRVALAAADRAGRAKTPRARWASRAALAAFLVTCFGYYRLCLAVGYVMAWGFLAGFLPAAPLAVVAVRTRHRGLRLAAEAAAFAAYFWCSGMLPAWKVAWAG